MSAYQAIDGWVRHWEVPKDPDTSALPDAAGASIIIRLRGEIIGRGSDFSGGRNSIVAASREAIAEAARRLPVENDALRDDAIRQVATEVTLSIELAGGLIPISPTSDESAASLINPGVDGVAARIGTRTAEVFPSAILMQSLSTRVALSSAASQAGNDPGLGLLDLNKLASEHDARFFRFRVVHLAQAEPGSAPMFLQRGGRIVNLTEITSQGLHAAADIAAEHLLTHAWPGAESYGMTGTYDPCRDVYDPRIGAAPEQLAACMALVRYAAVVGPRSARGEEVLRFVDHTMRDLATMDQGETDASADPAAAATWIVVTSDRAALGAEPAAATDFGDRCRRTVLGAYSMDDGFAPEMPPAARPLLALALVRLAQAEKAGAMRNEAVMLAESAVRRVFREAAPGELVAAAPWIGWAELELTNLKSGGKPAEVPSAVALRGMRAQVWEHQVGPTDAAAGDDIGGQDMVGGIVFSAGPRGGAPALPTWQSARPLALFATMLADPRLTSAEERPHELARLVTSLRFLRQLQMDESGEWMCQNPRRALGGVRVAPWDQRMPLDATAMSLLAWCETIRALEMMGGK